MLPVPLARLFILLDSSENRTADQNALLQSLVEVAGRSEGMSAKPLSIADVRASIFLDRAKPGNHNKYDPIDIEGACARADCPRRRP
jgi:hypothetical protein